MGEVIVLAPEADAAAAVPAVLGRIRFVPQAGPQERVLARFGEPVPMLAVFAVLPLADAAALPAAAPAPVLGFDVVFVAGGAGSPLVLRRAVEAWVAHPTAADAGDTVETLLFSDRILWQPGRAVVIGSAARFDELLPGLTEFAWYEGRLRRLEAVVAAHWAAAEDDIALTHRVGRRELGRGTEVDACMRQVMRWRFEHARLEPHLDKAAAHLPGAVRRLFNELAVQTGASDRLRTLDERIEILQDLYELATDRLTEFDYFRREYRIELLILAVLLVDLLLNVYGWFGG